MEIIELKTLNDWQNLKSQNEKRIILFKYSPICSLSFTAGRILEGWSSGISADESIIIAKVNVIQQRDISNKIESETGIMHESPQVIWFNQDGSVRWHESHFGISELSLNKQLTEIF